jgi:hypothetical protein
LRAQCLVDCLVNDDQLACGDCLEPCTRVLPQRVGQFSRAGLAQPLLEVGVLRQALVPG